MEPFVFISLGAGVQSSALLAMSALGLKSRGDAVVPKASVAIFADTQDEPPWVYEQVRVLEAWGAAHGLPVVRVTRGRLSADRRVQIPAFVPGKDGDATPLSRSCTRDYKISVVRAEAKRQMRAAGLGQATDLHGISVDEWERMTLSPVQWLTFRYPLVEQAMTRAACARVLTEVGLPVPRKSACRYCPYHGDAAWREIRDFDPEGWQMACDYDDRIRAERGASLHRSFVPLRLIDFGEDHPDLFGDDCGGNCGV